MDDTTTSALSPEIGRRILLCLDRSAASEAAVPYAVSLAKTFDGVITLLHVLDPLRTGRGPQAYDALAWEISRQEAQSYLHRVEGEVTRALKRPTLVRLEQGRPAERIVDLARELGADITVLGSGHAAESLGSTAQQVLAIAPCSVLVAPSSSSPAGEVTPRQILVPLDGSFRAESVLPAAVRISKAHGAALLLVHIVQEPLPTAVLEAAEGLGLARQLASSLESGASRYLELLRQRLARDGASVRALVARSVNDRKCLIEIARREQVDLIVLSAHGAACDSARSLGGVTDYLVGHTKLPVLVLQDLPERDPRHAEEDDPTLMVPPSLRASYASGTA